MVCVDTFGLIPKEIYWPLNAVDIYSGFVVYGGRWNELEKQEIIKIYMELRSVKEIKIELLGGFYFN